MTLFSVEGSQLFYRNRPVNTAEVHLHLDGALDKSDVLKIADQKGRRLYFPERGLDGEIIDYPSNNRQITTEAQLQELWHGWKKYTIPDMFDPVTGLMQTREEIIGLSKAHVIRQAAEGKVYIETRFAPQYHTKEGLRMDQSVGYVIEGLNLGAESAAAQGNKIVPKLIVCIGREAESDIGIKVAKVAIQFQRHGVVALDLACYEPLFPPERHQKAFELTFDSELKRTVHAGEMCSLEQNLRNILTAIYDLRADGLGHAKDLHLSNKLVAEVISRGIRIESNEVSNKVLGFSERIGQANLKKLDEWGVVVIINSDDPSMWPEGSLAYCLLKAAQTYGDKFVKRVIANPVKAAFGLDEQQKRNLTSILERQFD